MSKVRRDLPKQTIFVKSMPVLFGLWQEEEFPRPHGCWVVINGTVWTATSMRLAKAMLHILISHGDVKNAVVAPIGKDGLPEGIETI